MELLYKFFRYNYEVVNLYLDAVIFPVHTKQFKNKVVHNACHLAAASQGRLGGFSGTKDNFLLFPLQGIECGWRG